MRAFWCCGFTFLCNCLAVWMFSVTFVSFLMKINLKVTTMNRIVLMAMAVCLLTACEKTIESEENVDEVITTDGKPVVGKRFTFTVKGDFSSEWKPVTRGYLSADGKDMTDLWLFDYVDGQLVQQLHQGDNTAENFGKPQMTLSYGSHHVYFVASRGAEPALNTTNATITWSSVRDTFWKDYEVSVVSTSNGNRAVTLDRVVTKLMLTFTDAISSDAFSINFTPDTWYYGMDYTTGEPTEATTSQTIVSPIRDSQTLCSATSVCRHPASGRVMCRSTARMLTATSSGRQICLPSHSCATDRRNIRDHSSPPAVSYRCHSMATGKHQPQDHGNKSPRYPIRLRGLCHIYAFSFSSASS